MKVRILVLVLVLALILPVAVQASGSSTISCIPSISYVRTTATCAVRILADNLNDEIEAIITLWHGSTVIDRWEQSSDGSLSFSDTATVTPGLKYRLSVAYWINGEQQTTVVVEETCPPYNNGGAGTVSIGSPLPEDA